MAKKTTNETKANAAAKPAPSEPLDSICARQRALNLQRERLPANRRARTARGDTAKGLPRFWKLVENVHRGHDPGRDHVDEMLRTSKKTVDELAEAVHGLVGVEFHD
ncbi:MAG: hypothetical protein IID44_23585 [Planctomycetes bacterium]|nr:hypothetical protein [Planctomycetota bacterium]